MRVTIKQSPPKSGLWPELLEIRADGLKPGCKDADVEGLMLKLTVLQTAVSSSSHSPSNNCLLLFLAPFCSCPHPLNLAVCELMEVGQRLLV